MTEKSDIENDVVPFLIGISKVFSVVDKGLDYVNSPDADDTYSLGVHLHTVHGITSPSPKKSCWIHHWLYTLPPPPFRCCTPGLNPPPLINRLGFLPFIISTV